jgi:hypothetical protein
VPERIKELVPDVKLIYLVREPVARAISHYHFSVSVENERRSLDEALSDLSDPYSFYTCPGFYAVQIERYLRHFPQENMLIVNQTDLHSERLSALKEIFAFLQVDDSYVSPRFTEEFNTGKEQRTYSSVAVLHRRAKTSPLQRLPAGVRRFLRRSVEGLVSKPLERPEVNDDLRARLHELYAPDVERLCSLSGKKFPDWQF